MVKGGLSLLDPDGYVRLHTADQIAALYGATAIAANAIAATAIALTIANTITNTGQRQHVCKNLEER